MGMRIEQNDLVTPAEKVKGGGEPRGAGSNDGDTFAGGLCRNTDRGAIDLRCASA